MTKLTQCGKHDGSVEREAAFVGKLAEASEEKVASETVLRLVKLMHGLHPDWCGHDMACVIHTMDKVNAKVRANQAGTTIINRAYGHTEDGKYGWNRDQALALMNDYLETVTRALEEGINCALNNIDAEERVVIPFIPIGEGHEVRADETVQQAMARIEAEQAAKEAAAGDPLGDLLKRGK